MLTYPVCCLQSLVGSMSAHDVPTTINAVELMLMDGHRPVTGTSTGCQGTSVATNALPLCTVALPPIVMIVICNSQIRTEIRSTPCERSLWHCQ